jgi:hypothetical protein
VNPLTDDLVRTIASAFAQGADDTANLYTSDRWSDEYRHEMEAGARAVIDALGLREQRRYMCTKMGQLVATGEPLNRDCDRWEHRHVTDWEPVQ